MVSGGGRIRTDDLEVMSLASYRAAPPRVSILAGGLTESSPICDFVHALDRQIELPLNFKTSHGDSSRKIDAANPLAGRNAQQLILILGRQS